MSRPAQTSGETGVRARYSQFKAAPGMIGQGAVFAFLAVGATLSDNLQKVRQAQPDFLKGRAEEAWKVVVLNRWRQVLASRSPC